MEDKELEQFIRAYLAKLTRQTPPAPDKAGAWLRVQNHIRQTRLAHATSEKASVFVRMFRLGGLAVTAIILTLAVSLAIGVSKASEGSLPGETLYSVKRATETVEQILATSDEAKIKVGIKHAKSRLDEVKQLVADKKEGQIVTDTLQDLKSTTEQVLSAASAAQPELRDNAQNLVNEETQVLDSVKTQVSDNVGAVVQDVINSSQASAGKLKDGNTQDSTGETVQGAATSTPEDASKPPKSKGRDGVIESQIQLNGVTNSSQDQSSATPQEPKILPEPTLGF
jgi:hypothetical protein